MRLLVYKGSEWQRKHTKGFVRWYVSNYIPKSVQSKLILSIIICGNPTDWKKIATDSTDIGYCEYIEEDKLLGNEHCKVSLYAPANLLYYRFMTRLAHEIVHVKQYITHELKDRAHGSVFRKQHFPDDIIYWNSPWEIESLGSEYGLTKLYCEEAKIKEEVFTTDVKRIIC